MLTVIYGVPTAGKTFTLEKLIDILGLTDGTYNRDHVILVDTDDLLARVTMATTEGGWRTNDFDQFWHCWRNAPERVRARGEKIVKSIVNAYQDTDSDIHYIVFTNLKTIKPDIAFNRTPSSLKDIWIKRETEKNARRAHPKDLSVFPCWIENYSPFAYLPECPRICLDTGEYMFDYLEDIKRILPWDELMVGTKIKS